MKQTERHKNVSEILPVKFNHRDRRQAVHQPACIPFTDSEDRRTAAEIEEGAVLPRVDRRPHLRARLCIAVRKILTQLTQLRIENAWNRVDEVSSSQIILAIRHGRFCHIASRLAALKIGGALLRDMTSSPATSSPPF